MLINTFLLICVFSIFIESLFDFPKQRTIPNLYLWSFLGYFSIYFPSNINLSQLYSNRLKYFLYMMITLVAILGYMDYKSNQFSHQMLAFKNNKQYDLAIHSSNKALSYGKNVDNTGTPIIFYKGIFDYNNGNIEDSEKHFKKALELHPYHLGALENHMIIKAQLNDFNEALSTMHLLRDLYPNYYSPILNMAKLYIQKNKLLEAKVLIQDTKFDTDNKRILNILQKLLYYVEDRLEGSLDE